MVVALQPYINAAHDLWPWHTFARLQTMTDSLPIHRPLYRNIRRLHLHPRVTHSQLRWVAHPQAPAALSWVDSRARLGDLEKTSVGNRNRIIQILASLIRNKLSRRPSGLSFLCATITQPQTNKINSSTNTLHTTSWHSVWHVRTMSYWIRHGNLQCPEEPLWRSADRQCEAETQLRGLRKVRK